MSEHAQIMAQELCQYYLQNEESFCFETVFSHPSKIELIKQAKDLDYSEAIRTSRVRSAGVVQPVSKAISTSIDSRVWSDQRDTRMAGIGTSPWNHFEDLLDGTTVRYEIKKTIPDIIRNG